jgi:hypothetical protein
MRTLPTGSASLWWQIAPVWLMDYKFKRPKKEMKSAKKETCNRRESSWKQKKNPSHPEPADR